MKKNDMSYKQFGVYFCSSSSDLKKFLELYNNDIYITLFITQGAISLNVNENQILYKENNIIYFRITDNISFVDSDISNENDSSFECYAIFVNKKNYNDIMRMLGHAKGLETIDNNVVPHVSECVDIQFNKMIREIKTVHSTGSNPYDSCDTTRLFIASIYSRYIDDIYIKMPNYINVPRWFNDYYEMLDDPSVFTQDFSIIIQLSGKTREHISRLFKSIVGINISDYINSKRISYACQLLKNPENRIRDISNICGFTNIGTFYNNFKKKIGESPERYRKSSVATTITKRK